MLEINNVEILWDQMHVRLCRFLCSRIPNDNDAEDILQDVFLKIHMRLHTVKNMARLESWVYQIARNAIADYYRGSKTFSELTNIPVEDEYPELDAEESLYPYICEVVHSLPEPYREALLLTEYKGLSQKELASHLGISYSGAKSRVQRAREKVRDVILTCCHFEFDMRNAILDYYEHCCCCAAS